MSADKWVDLPGYEDLYQISNTGKIKSKPRDIKDSNGNIIRSLGECIVQVHKTSTHPRPYVILHDGTRYKNEVVADLLKTVSF